ncbi:MAG: L,D-transpeptidase [Lachnospiraceae bacterium]|nr:L,D-transpeptidase [Lachnospiraceae bacterium]
MKKNLIHKLLVLAAFTVLSLVSSKKVMAQPIGAVIYNFSGFPVPAGQPATFEMNQGMAANLLAKNPDQTPAMDAAGNFYADPAAVSSFVATLSSLYSTPGVCELDQVSETQYLMTLLNAGLMDYSHVPNMRILSVQPAAPAIQATSPAVQEAPALPETASAPASTSTYVDVNLTSQKLVYYVNGTPAIISDIVTGNSSRGRNTPTGVYAVYGKALNRTLRGPGYSAFVHYWMPFYKGYGMHDANWRSSFGGNIYQSNGSHGCINMPASTASALYSSIAVGTPVVIHT